jgi:hypothetical protein
VGHCLWNRVVRVTGPGELGPFSEPPGEPVTPSFERAFAALCDFADGIGEGAGDRFENLWTGGSQIVGRRMEEAMQTGHAEKIGIAGRLRAEPVRAEAGITLDIGIETGARERAIPASYRSRSSAVAASADSATWNPET